MNRDKLRLQRQTLQVPCARRIKNAAGNLILAIGLLLVGHEIFTHEASAAVGSPIQYSLSGTLADGGEFFGTFSIDPLAVDPTVNTTIGVFDLTDVNLRLNNTPLFTSPSGPAESGSTTEGTFIQYESIQQQVIGFTFLNDNSSGNVFTSLPFGPYLGNPNVAGPIEGTFLGGFFDGNGGSDIVSLSLTIVPEPGTFVLCWMAIGVGCSTVRRPKVRRIPPS